MPQSLRLTERYRMDVTGCQRSLSSGGGGRGGRGGQRRPFRECGEETERVRGERESK